MKKIFSLILLLLLVTNLIIAQNPTFRAQNIPLSSEVNFINDTFTESSDINLASHTPELGGTWVDHTDSAYPDTITVLGATDRTALNASAGAGAYYNTATPPSPDYCCEAVMNAVSIVSANSSIFLRVDTASNTGYIFQINNGTGWRWRKIVVGTQTTIGTEDTTTNLPSAGQIRTMKACSIGSTHTAYVNGVLLSSVGGSDSSITSAGKAGIRFSSGNTLTAGYHFESFRCFTP